MLRQYEFKGAPIVKKNTQRSMWRYGRPFIYYSKQYKEWAEAAGYEIMAQGRPAEPIAEPVILRCLFYMPTRRRVDLSALYEGIQDVLVQSGVLADDNFNIVAGHDGSRVLIDKDNPRTEVAILPCAN